MKVKFINFKEMAITQNTGMCSFLTIAWAVPYETNIRFSYHINCAKLYMAQPMQ